MRFTLNGLDGRVPTGIKGHVVRISCLLIALLLLPGLASAQSEEEQQTGAPATEAPAADADEASEPEDAADAGFVIDRVPIEADLAAAVAIEDAVERLVQLEVALAAESSPRVDAARKELAAVRGRLRDALLAVGALRAEQDLRAWLIEAGAVTLRPAAADPVEDLDSDAGDGGMDEAALRSLTSAIEAAPFNEGKLQALRDGLVEHRISTNQAATLLELFSFSRDRVDALVFLHPRLSDGENFGVLLSALKFESDRKAVRDRLGLDG